MEIPFSKWYAAIPRRRSRRQFEPRPIETALLAHLNTVCTEFRPFPEARSVLVTQSPDEFLTGAIGFYGKIKGALAFIAFIGTMDSQYVQERVGYAGEGIILEATAMNVYTCWVGASFRPEAVASLIGITKSERVLAITPIGYAPEHWSLKERVLTGFGRSHRRKSLSEMVSGLEEIHWPVWMKSSLEAARLAPSAVNRQPWRFHVELENITISVDNLKDTFHVSKRLDCGIAMLHMEVAALTHCVKGTWEFLEPPDVARFSFCPPPCKKRYSCVSLSNLNA
ncbi:MAG: nitroreductase [Nitrospira sp.]|nr:nitroreductase [Nitrospira sp.]